VNIDPIGEVQNEAAEAGDENWGAVVSRIRLRPEYARGLLGLDGFSHAVIVFSMHNAEFEERKHLVRRPRDREDMPLLGIFAQRARHRPSRIGVTTVEIRGVQGDTLAVSGLDAIDGSPVLDIKPHMPVFDAPSSVRQPEWVERLMTGYFGS
jgi:tRNA-Thr(GGU) m(6)t(6)A37 methyltransferase TsaA